MFITAPGLVQHLHPSQVALPQGRWPALTLAVERPWYLLVHRVGYRGGARSQTTLVGRDDTLCELLACMPVSDVTGIARLERRADAGPGWALQWVRALWAPGPDEPRALGPVLLQLDGDPLLRGTDLQAVTDEAPGRRLLYAAARREPPPAAPDDGPAPALTPRAS